MEVEVLAEFFKFESIEMTTPSAVDGQLMISWPCKE